MATQGQVTLNGRFQKGSHVALWKVKDETVLRHEGGELVATAKVDEDGRVQFKSGVEVGARYFVFGYVDGQPVEVRARGRSADDDSAVLAQAPITPDVGKLANGQPADQAPTKESAPTREAAPGPAQHQVPKGTPQRSDTPFGQATPVDPSEQVPLPRQEDVKKGTPQMSDTETGQATPLIEGATVRQEDAPKGLLQRSDTPRGVTTPIPTGDAVEAQRVKESSEAKAARGEPGKAAAEPLDAAKTRAPAKKTAKKRSAAKSSTRSRAKKS